MANTIKTLKRVCKCGSRQYEPGFLNPQGEFDHLDWSEGDEPWPLAWRCSNCWETRERKVYRRSGNTPKQMATVERIKAEALRWAGDKAELKTWTVEPMSEGSSTLVVTVEAGMEGDEGTMASIFCRYRAHVWVTRGGGCHAYGFKSKRVKGFRKAVTDQLIGTEAFDRKLIKD